MSRNRRDFLRSCIVLGAAGAAAQLERLGAATAFAQSAGDYRALVCVFLFGGNDSNNLIVPVDSRYSTYASLRGTASLAANSLLPLGGSGLGFHPALVNIQRLYNQNAAAVALNVGTLVQPTTKATINRVPLPANLQSHSDQQQQWQSSDPTGGETGWGGRLNDVILGLNSGKLMSGMAVAGGNPQFLKGLQTAPLDASSATTPGLTSFGSTSAMQSRVNSLQRLLTFDSGLKLVTASDGVLGEAVGSMQQLGAALASAPASSVTFPNTGLGRQFAQIAKLLSVRQTLGMTRQIFFASLGGFDTHENLVVTQQSLLAQLDAAVSSLFSAVDALGLTNKVTLFTESEFNRTGNINATAGSDHAWGGHHLVIGGAVKGGIYGTMPTLQVQGPDDMGNRGTWIPTTSLDQYAARLGGWFGVAQSDLDNIFPNLRNFPTGSLAFLPTDVVPFTDDPLIPQVTPIRAVHLIELRMAIATLRARFGLPIFSWTDAQLIPGVTSVRRVHVTELQDALAAVYVAAVRTPPVYSTPPGFLITTGELMELRAAVRAIW